MVKKKKNKGISADSRNTRTGIGHAAFVECLYVLYHQRHGAELL